MGLFYRDLLLSICAAVCIAIGGWVYGGTSDRRWLIVSACGFCLLLGHLTLLLAGY